MKAYDSKNISGDVLRQILISGSNNLFNHYPEVDALNVFPVPDGDTGTNMNLTMTSGSKEIMNIRSNNIYDVSKAFSRGLLMGARGNSGVILSQIFRGFSQALAGKESINVEEFAEAWTNGSKVAYKAVMRPVEGTILTVIRESSQALRKNLSKINSIGKAMDCLIKEAKASLKRTPDLLPVLKEVGVVDSGGTGLLKVFEGMLVGLKGEVIERKEFSIENKEESQKMAGEQLENEEFGYCTEFIIRLGDENKKPFHQVKFTATLNSLGNSLVVVRDEDIVKVHVHTLKPGVALNYAQEFGEFVKIKVENMQEQHSHILENADKEEKTTEKKDEIQEPKDYAIITTSVGEGLTEMFNSLRVNYIVSGGQTMNPSTEDFINAIKVVNAKNVFILPNNKNIIMAASQACDVSEGVNCIVIPTKTIPQGLTACMMFNEDSTPIENEETMRGAITNVKTGQVTFAIKDTKIDGVNIRKDDFMGISDEGIVCCEKTIDGAAKNLLASMIDDDSSIVSIIYGEGTTEEEAEALGKYLEEKYTIEVEVHFGGQPVYSYIFSVE